MILNVKNKVNSYLGKNIKFRYNGSRNQIEVFSGTIIACYNYIFIILVNGVIRSFSYSDVLIGLIDIDI